MKLTLTLIITITLFNSFGQTAHEFLKRGNEKEKLQNHIGAIEDFTKVIELDKNFTDAYYNRGTVKMQLSDFTGAISDFDQAIKLNPSHVEAYFNRGGIYAQKEKYNEALLDLNKVVELDEKFHSALTLRGQIKTFLKDTEGSCKDFYRAKEIGDDAAGTYISKYCIKKGINSESLNLQWPVNENWEMQSPQENDVMKLTEVFRNGETSDNWTETGTLQVYKGVIAEDVEARAKSLFDQTLRNCPAAKFTLIEMEKKVEYPWIMFSIECPVSGEYQSIESQVWHIVQGKSSLYISNRAVREKYLPADLKLKWTAFFKTAKIVSP